MQFLDIKVEDIVDYDISIEQPNSGATYYTVCCSLENEDTFCYIYKEHKDFIRACNILRGVLK